MSKIEDLKTRLLPLISNHKKLEKFLIENSNLPGPRANLELLFALSEVYEDFDTILEWSKISEEQADTNAPKSFLVVCSLVCMGRIYTKNNDKKIIEILKEQSNDKRWRIREGVTFGLQIIGESNFNELVEIIDNWIKDSSNLEKRAILVSLAHPKFLNKENAIYCFNIADQILSELKNDEDYTVLKKGLEFTISVFVAANDVLGFEFLEKWIGKSDVIDRIIKENLKKKRVKRIDVKKVEVLLKKIK
ncbi:MAG: hypothetical protein IPM32_10945 [Ignavibacteriae bacterium]|nr:hypothetical protein [Ignavibacteriota bacterium]